MLNQAAVCAVALLLAGCVAGVEGAATPDEAQLAAAAEARATNANRPTQWWNDLSKKSASWYRTDQAATVAENILSWQDPALGGWPLMNTIREKNRGEPSQAGPWGVRPALIKATVNEIRFLARAHQATEREAYANAAARGLDFIYAAQYETGGWPHSYPLRDDYSRYATYNDDEMPDLMALLQEVATAPEFGFVGREGRARARAAFDRGVDFVLKSQIRVDGVLTAWGQQHDEITYEPRAARAFEPVAISGGESASVLHMLMHIREPSDEVKEAIEAGVQWYRDAQIDGLRLIRENGDREVVPDANAPPMWARFYEIGTMRPIFQGRDGVRRYAMAEIEKERRGGYAWYNYSGTAVFEHYERWKEQREWDRQRPANVDEAKVGDYSLPPIMRMADGAPVRTVEQWETSRRPEIMRLLAEYQEGVTPQQDIETTFKHAAWLEGGRFALTVHNLFDEKPQVTNARGDTPISYQPDEIDAGGRTIEIGFRKQLS